MERVLQITEAVIDSLQNNTPDLSTEPLTAEDFLSHMYLLRVHDPVEQLAVVNNLPTILDQHKEVNLWNVIVILLLFILYPLECDRKSCGMFQVKLIVFDSITFLFRQDFEDMAGRTRLLANMAQKLMAVAENYDVAVSQKLALTCVAEFLQYF